MASSETPQDALVLTAYALDVDRTTAEVVTELRTEGVPSILLKGPALASWLYDDGAARTYVDSDLLVPPALYERAREVLRRLGFQPLPAVQPQPRFPHSEAWTRSGDGADIDLHRTLSGATAPASLVWRIMERNSEEMRVGGTMVRVPTTPARAVIAAFHASQHGADVVKPVEDLTRAIERAPEETWREAAALAVRLDGTPALVMGLHLVRGGAALAERLGLASEALVREVVDPDSNVPLALGFQRLSERKGVPAKLKLVLHEALPSREYMRWRSPLARRGALGLGAAYVARLGWLFRYAIPSARAWHREQARSQPLAPLSPVAKSALLVEILMTWMRVRWELPRTGLPTLLRELRTTPRTTVTWDEARAATESLRLGRAVTRAFDTLPFHSTCLIRSLVLTRLLARRGVESEMVIGVRPGEEFGAHAWVELGGRPLLPAGGTDFERLVEL